MNNQTILIIGASGIVGSEVVRILKSEGHTVRTATSKVTTHPDSVQINLATGEGIRHAFEGVDKAFLLSPPGYADQHKMLSPLIQEAKRRGLKKVVLMTAMGANADEKSPFRRAEVELEKSGLDYNIVRPNWFMQNFATFWVGSILEQGKILLPAGTAKTSFIDAKDISAVVAKLLTTDQFPKQAFDITGPEAIDHAEVAKHLSAATGNEITYEDIAPEVLKSGLLKAGLPADYVDFLILIFGYLKAGYSSAVTGEVRKIIGREPRAFETYAKEAKASWLTDDQARLQAHG